jgi:fumarate hydratase class II
VEKLALIVSTRCFNPRLELNATRPVIINNFLHSATILGDACGKLRQYCIEGTELHREQIDSYVHRSLMLVTALSPVIGYDKASAIAHKANDEGSTLREAALATGYVSAHEFDRAVNPFSDGRQRARPTPVAEPGNAARVTRRVPWGRPRVI